MAAVPEASSLRESMLRLATSARGFTSRAQVSDAFGALEAASPGFLAAADGSEEIGLLNDALLDTKIMCEVHFQTARDGARIKYRLAARKDESQSSSLTNSVSESICVGFYVVWPEREGKATGKPQVFKILDERQDVVVEEDPPKAE